MSRAAGSRALGPALLALALAASSCGQTVCSDGTVSRFNAASGDTECVAPSATAGVQCDTASGSKIEGGVCKPDPSKFPSCGPGTVLDKGSNQCIATSTGQPVPKACANPQPAGTFCVNGVIRLLKNGQFATGVKLEVRAYDPIAFLFGMNVQPQVTTPSDDGSYVLNGVTGGAGCRRCPRRKNPQSCHRGTAVALWHRTYLPEFERSGLAIRRGTRRFVFIHRRSDQKQRAPRGAGRRRAW